MKPRCMAVFFVLVCCVILAGCGRREYASARVSVANVSEQNSLVAYAQSPGFAASLQSSVTNLQSGFSLKVKPYSNTRLVELGVYAPDQKSAVQAANAMVFLLMEYADKQKFGKVEIVESATAGTGR